MSDSARESEFIRPGTLLTREFFPRLAPALRWLWSPLGSLAMAAVASALCGLILHPRGFVVLAGLLAVIALGTARPWLSVLGLAGTLRFDRARAREGESVAARLSLRNRSPWGAWGLLIDDGCRDGPDVAAAGIARAPGWRTTEVGWEFVPGCRGVYPSRTPRVATGFPFGIRVASRPLDVASRLVVWPRTFPVGPIVEADRGRRSEGGSPQDRPGPSGDFLGVRPYRRGDPLRRIHWPQTARHDRLVVCELQRQAAPALRVVLDTHDDVHAGSGPDGSREWAIRIAASFLERGIEQGADVEAVFGGRAVAPKGGSVATRRALVLDALAEIGPEGIWTLDDLLEMPACRRACDGLRIIVTTDLGLRRSRRGAPRDPRDRLVVLKASAFAGGGEEGESGPPDEVPACWIWVDDPGRAARCLRRSGKEAALGR